MRIVRGLAEEIGVRWAGSQAEAKAAKYVYKCFAEIGLEAKFQKIRVLGWRQILLPELVMLSPRQEKLKAAPMIYGGSTPDSGLSGKIVKIGKHIQTPGDSEFVWNIYGVMSDEDDLIAYIIARSNGPAIPMINHSSRMVYTFPTVIIGAVDENKLNEFLSSSNDVIVRLKVKGDYDPNTFIENVIATIPGEKSKVIAISAHHDSPFGSPGAVDDATGVETIIHVAKQFVGSRPKYTLKFISFGGEEPHLFGSRYYVRDIKERGLLSHISLNINLDIVGIGEKVRVTCGPEPLKKNIKELLKVYDCFEGREIVYGPPTGGADDRAFSEQGIPTIYIAHYPRYAQYHLPSDTVEIVNEKLMENTVSAVKLLLDNAETLFLQRI